MTSVPGITQFLYNRGNQFVPAVLKVFAPVVGRKGLTQGWVAKGAPLSIF